MLCLELFKGIGSTGRAFEKLGWSVVSVDINPKFKPTICVNILDWDYTCFPKDYFQFVGGSPCCTHYSKARTTGGPRDLEGADRLVSKTLEIIAYFGCNWAFEKPQSGLLKTRDLVRGLPFFDTSYCRYGYGYRKTTRIWSNLTLCLRTPCSIRDPCPAMVGNRHPKTAQQSRRGNDPTDHNNTCSRAQLYSIPPTLCDEIAATANRMLLETDDSTDQPDARTHVPSPASFVSEELRSNPSNL